MRDDTAAPASWSLSTHRGRHSILSRGRRFLGAWAIGLLGMVGTGDWDGAWAEEKPSSREAADFFETAVRPVLSESCHNCHGPKKQSSGLRLDSLEAILAGGDSGPAVVPGKPDESLLIQAVARTHESLKMPPKRKLPAPVVAALRRWVEMGAPWANEHARGPNPGGSAGQTDGHWAFVPPRAVAPPASDSEWVRSPVDAFVLERLKREGLSPSPSADRRTLIRRAAIDLLGIPPTYQEIQAFEADPSPDAYARLIDRLLASPRYGERWGRHWLDVARYADTKGYVFQEERKYPFAYTYRDYVIRTFNEDLPYDRFILEQIAADQLDLAGDPRPLAAMGFLTVGRRFLNDQNEIIDDRIDLIGRGLLGLSIGCARCHDHKYDPIPIEDYYSLYGVFASSVEPPELPRLDLPGAPPAPGTEALEKEIQAARKARDDFAARCRADLQHELQSRYSRYFRAAYDLDLNPRHPKLDQRAGQDKLNTRVVRLAIAIWKRRLDAAEALGDPILGPLRACTELPREAFAAKAPGILAGLAKAHPLLTAALRDHPPTNMADMVARYVDLFAALEARCRPPAGKPDQAPSRLADPQWESLRMALFGPSGPASIPVEGARFVFDPAQRQQFTRLSNAVQKLEASSAGKVGRAMVMNDAPRPVDPRVFLRGNPGRPGKTVPRRFLQVLSGPDRPSFQKGSGRLELARAIADPRNPLTARVLVNRVWHWHFGQGLVATPGDLGLRSDPPSHPELLDWLAQDFVAGGWSIKSLHRTIMLSAAYQQQSGLRPDCHLKDPQNRLVWRFNRQRLDFETMRDALLAVAGTLDPAMTGPSVELQKPAVPFRRTVYGFIDRQNMDGVYRTFDFPVPDTTNPRRFVTSVPQQALFLMNSPFVQQQAESLAAHLENAQGSSAPDARVQALYERVLGRLPEPAELARAAAFLQESERASESLPPLARLAQVLLLTNEFMFVD